MEAYQLKLVLRGVSPMIWRRLLVRKDMSLAELHKVIQVVMGWDDDFLHRFHIHGKDYTTHYLEGLDARYAHLQNFKLHPSERFLYEYNFFSLWQFDVRFEKVISVREGKPLPVCTAGNGDAPPENCGGPKAFFRLLDERWSMSNTEAIDTLVRNLAPALEALLSIEDAAEADKQARAAIDRSEVSWALEQLESRAELGIESFDRQQINTKLREGAA